MKIISNHWAIFIELPGQKNTKKTVLYVCILMMVYLRHFPRAAHYHASRENIYIYLAKQLNGHPMDFFIYGIFGQTFGRNQARF